VYDGKISIEQGSFGHCGLSRKYLCMLLKSHQKTQALDAKYFTIFFIKSKHKKNNEGANAWLSNIFQNIIRFL
jgi:hypothetical protein